MKRWVLILIAAGAWFAFQQESQAQSFKEWGLKIWNKMMAPDKNLDSTYVFQPFKGWNVSPTYKARWDRIGIDAPIRLEMDGETKVEGEIRLKLINDVTHHIGVGGGYGPIRLGYSVAVGKGNKKDRHFSFDWADTKFAAQLYYSNIHDIGSCDIDLKGFVPGEVKDFPVTASIWRVSGFYIFNHKKFSYPSAYTGKLVQRKSAGSFLAGAKFLNGNVSLPEKKSIVSSLMLNLVGYSTWQASIGAGYSFNWVLYHRDAESGKNIRRLRNLTFNITAIPQLTVVNEMRMSHLIKDGEEKVPVHGRLWPNALGKVGLCYAIGHFYINGSFEFNYNRFRSGELTQNDFPSTASGEPEYYYKLNVLGHLSNCVGSFEVHYRF
ncbi:MAG: DUF4421 family protein [Bacteroidales bacterium]|nr:DUF4421 family protein [Bacteroidales bacterium]